jgi:hypothetical protein
MASDRAKRQMDRLLADGGAEEVVYQFGPKVENALQEQELPAIVDRGAPTELMHATPPTLHATFLLDADPTVGIASPSAVDTGVCRVLVAARRGGTAASHRIAEVIDEGDPDFIKFRLE